MATVVSTASSPPTSNHSASEETTTSNWEYLRRSARKLEGDLDVRLSSYAKLSVFVFSLLSETGFSDKKGSTNDMQWKTLEMEIEILLVKLTEVNEDMSQWASATVVGATTAVMQRLTRHREILHELTQEFKRTKKNLLSVKEHAELLTSVRNDIHEHKSPSKIKSERNLLRERAAIHGGLTQIDEVIDQAEATRSALTAQRSAFGEIQGKLKLLKDKFPLILVTLGTDSNAIHQIIPHMLSNWILMSFSNAGAIKRKKSKDDIIVSAVVALCTLFLVAYWFAK
ncbi:Golgi SNAP receptor complex member 1-2-like isoform X1 [Carex littledalei]|uniref:Golgi SNAP receptor complex member 1-2-like isoform X1 n=1 Tax=Carex littledalei TaxID=544730 RepID=A0A833VGK5_9POAL|nr:Golgi SNAP receptor complex member 1-2-like isoform X1 [Carex littledalei]